MTALAILAAGYAAAVAVLTPILRPTRSRRYLTCPDIYQWTTGPDQTNTNRYALAA